MRKFLVFSAFLCFLTTKAWALLPDFTHNTPSVLEPAAVSQSYQVAGIYWLPDYLGKNMDTNGRINDRNNGGDKDKSCSDYGFNECRSPKTIRYGAKPVHVIQGLKCYKDSDCICSTTTFPYTSYNCSGNRELSGRSCENRYQSCTCKSKFSYNSSNCKGEFTLSGTSCDGKYERCDPKPCSDGGYSDSIVSGKSCSPVTYGGRTCQACRDKSCQEKCSGFESGLTCAKGQETQTCSSDCGSYIKCSGEACPTAVGNCEYGCQAYSTQKNCTDVCVECKKCVPTCSDKTNCPHGNVTVDNGCGGTCSICKELNCPTGISGKCDYGCKTYSTQTDCTNICLECNTCTPTDCSAYTLAEKNIANAIYEECTPGCGDTQTRYKFAQCMINYADTETYWCSKPYTTDCSSLGYNMSDSECSGQQIVRCPFDSSRLFCY